MYSLIILITFKLKIFELIIIEIKNMQKFNYLE